jgi:hypothetical protein
MTIIRWTFLKYSVKLPEKWVTKPDNMKQWTFIYFFNFFLAQHSHWARFSSFTRFVDHTQRHTTVAKIPLDECLARRRDLDLTIHNAHSRQTSMPQVRFEPTISAGELPQTHVLDRAAIRTGAFIFFLIYIWKCKKYSDQCKYNRISHHNPGLRCHPFSFKLLKFKPCRWGQHISPKPW